MGRKDWSWAPNWKALGIGTMGDKSTRNNFQNEKLWITLAVVIRQHTLRRDGEYDRHNQLGGNSKGVGSSWNIQFRRGKMILFCFCFFFFPQFWIVVRNNRVGWKTCVRSVIDERHTHKNPGRLFCGGLPLFFFFWSILFCHQMTSSGDHPPLLLLLQVNNMTRVAYSRTQVVVQR